MKKIQFKIRDGRSQFAIEFINPHAFIFTDNLDAPRRYVTNHLRRRYVNSKINESPYFQARKDLKTANKSLKKEKETISSSESSFS